MIRLLWTTTAPDGREHRSDVSFATSEAAHRYGRHKLALSDRLHTHSVLASITGEGVECLVRITVEPVHS